MCSSTVCHNLHNPSLFDGLQLALARVWFSSTGKRKSRREPATLPCRNTANTECMFFTRELCSLHELCCIRSACCFCFSLFLCMRADKLHTAKCMAEVSRFAANPQSACHSDIAHCSLQASCTVLQLYSVCVPTVQSRASMTPWRIPTLERSFILPRGWQSGSFKLC